MSTLRNQGRASARFGMGRAEGTGPNPTDKGAIVAVPPPRINPEPALSPNHTRRPASRAGGTRPNTEKQVRPALGASRASRNTRATLRIADCERILFLMHCFRRATRGGPIPGVTNSPQDYRIVASVPGEPRRNSGHCNSFRRRWVAPGALPRRLARRSAAALASTHAPPRARTVAILLPRADRWHAPFPRMAWVVWRRPPRRGIFSRLRPNYSPLFLRPQSIALIRVAHPSRRTPRQT